MADAGIETIDLYRLAEGLGAGELASVPDGFVRQIPQDCLLSQLGIVLTQVGRGSAVAEMTLGRGHLNQRGIAQAGAIVALADAAAGWASYSAIDHGRFTTVDLSTHLLRAGRDGDRLRATASPVRLGRRVQVIDVAVHAIASGGDSGDLIARFTCSQLVLEPAAREANS
jgi:1,4-dihydroxy-2-naphthoyl-CoA hydrolase